MAYLILLGLRGSILFSICYFWSKSMVHPESVAKILGALDINKAMGPDNVHPKLLRYLSEDSSFVYAVVLLLSACSSEKCIPEIWKTATVVALHKKGSVHNPNAHRPVSLTCIMCKVYEKLIREYILDGIEAVLSDKQHGFMRGRSCLSNLLETMDAVNDLLAEGGCADILYFDFSKTFDSVPHHRLLVKLKNFGIPDDILGIIENFLAGRSMRVKVGLNDNYLTISEQEKDLGILTSNTLLWTDQISSSVSKANKLICWITRNLINKDRSVMLPVYKTLIRPHLEYCVQLWNPVPEHGNWSLILKLEGVQRRFTRMIDGVGLLPYSERLETLKLTTLIERRARGDLIEVFKAKKEFSSINGVFKFSRSGMNLISTFNNYDGSAKFRKLKRNFIKIRTFKW